MPTSESFALVTRADADASCRLPRRRTRERLLGAIEEYKRALGRKRALRIVRRIVAGLKTPILVGRRSGHLTACDLCEKKSVYLLMHLN